MSSFVQSLESRRHFDAGSLDITYGNGAGIGTDLLPVGNLVVSDSAVQAGDRLLVAGKYTPSGGAAQNFLARYSAEGKRDNNFVGTAAVLSNPRGMNSLDLIAVQNDGKILLLDRDAGGGSIAVIRLTPKGVLDASFGKSGSATFSFSTAREMIVGDDGKILIVGDDGNNVKVARLTIFGTLDTTFGSKGIFTGKLNLTGVNSEDVTYSRTANFISELPDGRVLVAGSFNLHESNPVSDFSRPFVARLTAAGQADATFSGDGTLQITTEGNATARGFATLGNGKVLIAVATADTSTLLRLNLDGSTDRKFGFNGTVALDGASRGILVQPDGKIIVQTPSQFQRYQGDGAFDADFKDNNANSGDGLVGLGGDGSLLSVSVTHKTLDEGIQYKIRPARRWSEVAPAGLLAAPDVAQAPKGPYRFSIQWRAEFGVAISSLAASPIQIVGPGGATYKAAFLATTKPGNGIQRTANYKFAIPGGAWDASDSGIYTVRLLGSIVSDNQGNRSSKQTLGTFTIQIPVS